MRGAEIKKTGEHDAGAYGRCEFCGRYSDDPTLWEGKNHRCDCGQYNMWDGSFDPPDASSVWNTIQ